MAHVEPCVKLRRREGGDLTWDRNKQERKKKSRKWENVTCVKWRAKNEKEKAKLKRNKSGSKQNNSVDKGEKRKTKKKEIRRNEKETSVRWWYKVGK